YESACKNTAHPPLYLTLFGMFLSLFFQDHFTKWSGELFNLIFYVISIVVFYDLSSRFFRNRSVALFSSFLYGISIAVVSCTLFIRPYSMLLCSSIAFMDIHISMLDNKNRWLPHTKIKSYFALIFCFLVGAATHYYFLVFAFFICLGYGIVLLFINKKRLVLEYIFILSISLSLYYVLWPNFYRDLLFGYRGTEAISNLTTFSSGFFSRINYYSKMLNTYLFGGLVRYYLLLLLALIILKSIINCYYKISNTHFHKNVSVNVTVRRIANIYRSNLHGQMIFIIIFASVCYFLLIAKIAPPMPYGNVIFMELRYFSCIFPCIILVLIDCVDYSTKQVLKSKRIRLLMNVFLAVIVIFGYIFPGVDYLYKGAERHLDILDNYAQDRAVFITDVTYYCSNLNVYFSKNVAVYQTDTEGITQLSKAFDGLDEPEIILYIDSERRDKYKVLESVYTRLNATDCRFLFETAGLHRADVYVLNI
nr:glycosyltransferase family 39 protein [Lachnospiraceae bacterium]